MLRPAVIFFFLGSLFFTSVLAEELPWTTLLPAHDSRDPEMIAWDESDTRRMIQTINDSERFAQGRFKWARVQILDLLDTGVPFVDFHFDSVNPVAFTDREKSVLQEWIERGGFLLCFEDTYPYEQENFRKCRSLPVFDFFTRELPAADPRFTVGKVDDRHPIFHALYQTTSTPSIQREMRENPNYRGRTVLYFDGRIVAFFMGRYNNDQEGRWVPLARPFPPSVGFDIRSYYLMLNIYVYAMTH